MTKVHVMREDGSLAYQELEAIAGPPGAIGPKGDTGEAGPQGPKGETGPAGRDGTGGGSYVPGAILFDSFPGNNDSEKVESLNTWARLASGPNKTVVFDARQYNFDRPIKLFSGLKLIGAYGLPAREYTRATTFNWQGGSGTSMLVFPPEGQTGQSYPSDGSPRDITMSGIQFQGGGSTHFMPKFSPGDYVGKTLWYCNFHNCGWKNFNTVWWGAGTGTSFSGISHFQGITDTAFYVGGSECSFFGRDAYSFADTQTVNGKPFFRSSLQKSSIGMIMITARRSNYMLSIENGHNLVVDGVAFDAQSGDPTYGPAIRMTGSDGVTISNCTFKGVATNLGTNKGWVEITGGKQVTIHGNNFRREGNNMPASSVPVVYVGGTATGVKVGYNNYSNFDATAVVQASASDKVVVAADSSVKLIIQ